MATEQRRQVENAVHRQQTEEAFHVKEPAQSPRTGPRLIPIVIAVVIGLVLLALIYFMPR